MFALVYMLFFVSVFFFERDKVENNLLDFVYYIHYVSNFGTLLSYFFFGINSHLKIRKLCEILYKYVYIPYFSWQIKKIVLEK